MNATNKYYKKVIACPKCSGHGEVFRDTDPHSCTYERETCSKCMGKGLLVRKVTVEYEPFIADDVSIVII